MKLNEQATLELTASTWLVIAQDGVSKAQALRLLGFVPTDDSKIGDFVHNCPCCEHVLGQGKMPGSLYNSEIRECAQVCLLDGLWPKGCEHSTSPFKAWLFPEIIAEKSQYAMEIAMFSGILAGTWSIGLEEQL